MAIILYGPPGMGKTTLIKLAAMRGLAAMDLEYLGDSPSERRIHARVLGGRPILLGAADTSPSDYGSDNLHVLLMAGRQRYDARRRLRDASQPGKAAQGDYYDMFAQKKDQFDAVADTDRTPDETLDLILAFAAARGHKVDQILRPKGGRSD